MQWAPTPTPASASASASESSTLPVRGGAAGGPRSPLGALEMMSKNGPNSPATPRWASRDPRTSSTQSLVPSTDDGSEDGHRRRLLVVYIHGFMGNNSSFRSFPAHVHSFLKGLLAETHAIHTKIYPRYKTYKSIDVACENFSKWLAPHESPTTDVVLIGHSMGGLLAADVVLLSNQGPYNASSPFRHRILGTISLDAPLLGLHPGIVVSGIASLFRPAPSPSLPEGDTQTEYTTPTPTQPHRLSPDPSIYSEVSPPLGSLSPAIMPYPTNSLASSGPNSSDPYFDPPFVNDVAFVDRGWFKNIVHFATKHKEENLVSAAANHILSHLEFGACLADYPELRSRYKLLRRLEDVDDYHQSGGSGTNPVRVRFANYYTVSTGVIKKPKPASPNQSPRHSDVRGNPDRSSLEDHSPVRSPRKSAEGSRAPTPRISIEEYSDGQRRDSLQILDPMPEPEPEPAESSSKNEENKSVTEPTTLDDETPQDDPSLPAIPDLPSPPPTPDLDAIPDKEARKQAQKAFKLAQKTYSQAVKAREKAIKDRQKALDKQQRKAVKLEKKQAKLLLQQQKQQSERDEHHHHPDEEEEEDDDGAEEKKKTKKKQKTPRLRKFCMVPSKSDNNNNNGDPTWVEIYMEGVDEVGAHCGLFMPGPHYEPLVGDVGERIADWVREDASRRVVMEGRGGGGMVGEEGLIK
ncbi:hypothetical protein C8A00DRAFT_31189 [Chaetomidium leptoderma]|uniref:AB hydrolase-1 domain-containing protein n=1 Tax=Chaetomidium leptoderma TaxID=669021 RepID=A0AAN6VQI5_9PEZI|nr:hypothetical protein C8A00DRAFT_31189 [Chaetomidium leptoderma]